MRTDERLVAPEGIATTDWITTNIIKFKTMLQHYDIVYSTTIRDIFHRLFWEEFKGLERYNEKSNYIILTIDEMLCIIKVF